eukprot:TRINITY_DN6152_c0_g2_i7.p2 TRINITY_DN6152_c0_g2~~TRINITY_DN6152_c0_g2_i7.p2  ORF type:complete len:180 (-),score=15.95 TRINITY_DN6152_c0_g2_i7:290-829(-)
MLGFSQILNIGCQVTRTPITPTTTLAAYPTAHTKKAPQPFVCIKQNIAACTSTAFASKITFTPFKSIIVVASETLPAIIPSIVEVGCLKASAFAFTINVKPCSDIPRRSSAMAADAEMSSERREGAVLISHIFTKYRNAQYIPPIPKLSAIQPTFTYCISNLYPFIVKQHRYKPCYKYY